MMHILPAVQADVPALIDLWQEAFGETKEEVLPFFREILPLCRPWCVKDGDTLCAMAYALPQPLHTEAGTLPAAYLYAVPTKREYRGRGLASRLLDEMARALKGEGICGLLLVPANLPLFDFYAKLGFSPFSHRGKQQIFAEDTPVSAVSAEEYRSLREAFAPPVHNVPPAPVLRHLSLFAWEGGCAAAERTPEGVIFRELLGDVSCAGGVLRHMEAGEGTAILPEGDVPYAVACPLSEAFPKTGYFAFAME